MNAAAATVGTRVKTTRSWVGVKTGTIGLIVEDYGDGVTIAWDLPDQPIPSDMTCAEIAAMFAVNPKCPLRDGFDKQTELQWLELADDNA